MKEKILNPLLSASFVTFAAFAIFSSLGNILIYLKWKQNYSIFLAIFTLLTSIFVAKSLVSFLKEALSSRHLNSVKIYKTHLRIIISAIALASCVLSYSAEAFQKGVTTTLACGLVELGFLETAEVIYAINHGKNDSSFLVLYQKALFDYAGQRPNDKVFDSIISRVYGQQSYQMVERYLLLGTFYEANNKIGAAEECIKKAIAISQKLENKSLLFWSLNDLSHVFILSKNGREVVRCYERAEEIGLDTEIKRMNITSDLAIAVGNCEPREKSIINYQLNYLDDKKLSRNNRISYNPLLYSIPFN